MSVSPAARGVSMSFNLSVAFELTDEALTDLERTLSALGLVTHRAALQARDRSTLKYDSLTGVKDFPNSPGRRAKNLDVTALGPDGTAASLSFSESPDFGESVTIMLSGPDEWVLKARRDLEEWLKTTKRFYAPIAEAPWSKIIWGSILAFFAYFAWVIRDLPQRPGGDTPRQTGNSILLVIALLLVMFAWDYTVKRAFRYVFPLGLLAFGKYGGASQKLRGHVRAFVFGTVLLGIAINVFSNYLSK